MRYNKLGRTGLDVSVIGLGMEHLVPLPENIEPVVQKAIDRGINYIDLMIWVPGVVSVLGAALKGHRDKMILAGHLGGVRKPMVNLPSLRSLSARGQP